MINKLKRLAELKQEITATYRSTICEGLHTVDGRTPYAVCHLSNVLTKANGGSMGRHSFEAHNGMSSNIIGSPMCYTPEQQIIPEVHVHKSNTTTKVTPYYIAIRQACMQSQKTTE